LIFSAISCVLIIFAVALLLKLTPEQISNDMMNLITPNDSLRDKARNLRGDKKKHPLYTKLIQLKTALTATGKSKQFSIVCCASLVLFAIGAAFSFLINNLFLMPVLSAAFALLPFLYITSTLAYYEKKPKKNLKPRCRLFQLHISEATIFWPQSEKTSTISAHRSEKYFRHLSVMRRQYPPTSKLRF
jgi:hypothetical protein